MKFMVIVKATHNSEAGELPDERILHDMMKFNEELQRAGVLLDGAGLQPSAKGARVRFEGGARTVVDGPFTETKELVAGFWVLQCTSLAECIEWVKRCPDPHPGAGPSEIEIRPFYELGDFPAANAETIERATRLEQQRRR